MLNCAPETEDFFEEEKEARSSEECIDEGDILDRPIDGVIDEMKQTPSLSHLW